MAKITALKAIEILDSRGTPTLQVSLYTDEGISGVASVPSGASTGEFEALEFDALAVGDVIENQGGEIRLPGLWTQAGKLRYFHVNPIVALRARIWESVNGVVWLAGH